MNRLFDNVYIIDTGGLWLTVNSASNGDYASFEIQNALFVGSGGSLEITVESNTASNTVVRILTSASEATKSAEFPKSLCVDQRMFVKTCVGGTGFLYLS